MSLRRFVLAMLVVAAVSYSAVADDPASPTPSAPAPAANVVPTTTTTTPATPVSTGATTLPPVVGLDTDSAADAVSETFLTMTLAYFNQSHLGAGIFADTVASEVYEDEDSGELLGAQVALAQQVEQQIISLSKAPGHDRDDLEVIEGFKKLAQLNRIQWETLRDVLGGDESKSKIWDEVRDTMLKELEKYAEEEPSETTTPAAPNVGPAAPTTK
jgi:hypothetical protein